MSEWISSTGYQNFWANINALQGLERARNRTHLIGPLCHLVIDELDLSKSFPVSRFLHHFWVHSVARDERTLEIIVEASLKDTNSSVTEMLFKLTSEADKQKVYDYPEFDLVVNRNGKFLHCGEPFWIIPKEAG